MFELMDIFQFLIDYMSEQMSFEQNTNEKIMYLAIEFKNIKLVNEKKR